MKNRIVTDEDVDRALAYLRDSAIETGKARAEMIKTAHYVKHVEALKLLASDEKSVEARKAWAKTTPEWIEAINAEAEAAGQWEKLKSLREAAAAIIEAWRSESANYRGMKV